LNENSPSSIEVKHIVDTIENFSKTEVVTMKKFFN
jgi:hypothetical protein